MTLRDFMFTGWGIFLGWVSMAGLIWLAILNSEREYKDEE